LAAFGWICIPTLNLSRKAFFGKERPVWMTLLGGYSAKIKLSRAKEDIVTDQPMTALEQYADVAPAATRSSLRVFVGPLDGWRKVPAGEATLWLKGDLLGNSETRLTIAARQGVEAVQMLLPELDGRFAIVLLTKEAVLAATDQIASIPVFVALKDGAPGTFFVGGQALDLADKAGLGAIDRNAALAIGMAGYALGTGALLKGLRHLRAGEFVILRHDTSAPEYGTYSSYRPWLAVDRPRGHMVEELAGVLRSVFTKMVAGAAGRPIMVPLSAGYDSRLVAAALKELRYPDVRCYSYGIPGNYEAVAGRTIAECLGLPWSFVLVTPAIQRDHFASAAHASYTRFADTLTAIPFNQDYLATRTLLDNGYAPKNAIFVNGQTGDFISGNHVPRELWKPPRTADAETRWNRLFAAARSKHFALWNCLETPQNLARMAAMFRVDLEEQGGLPDDPALDWSLYEASEFMHRQSRYVVAGQRIYEHLGADWRLPLWDRELVAFFETVPLGAKQDQNLYRETLRKLNWGGVFGDDIPVNRRNIRPRWLKPVRAAAKVLSAPLGRAKWHSIERQYFGWHMDPLANYAVVPWSRVASDRRGFRNAISWHAEAYLAGHGITLESLAAGEQ
jgi:asparagine synthase (glutamine-hydrolysing)